MIYDKKIFFFGVPLIVFATTMVGVTTGPQNPMAGGMINQGFANPPYNPMNINEPTSNMAEEQEFNNMLTEIESYRNNLSKDDQIKFDKEVNETASRMQARMDDMIKNDPSLEDRLSKQDPEAINSFLSNVFQPEFERVEAEQATQQPPLPPEVGPTVPAEEGPSILEKAEEKPSKEKVKKIDVKSALELIGSIVEYLESFKEKTNMVIKFPGYYEKWAKEGRLHGWTRELTWEKFSEKLEQLIDRFKELERKDPDTNEYTHLSDLIENESLYHELTQFNNDLADNEPRIVIPEAGIGDMNSASKDAARQILNVCLYGITKLQNTITALIGKYEKTAKKISEEKEKARQKAEQAAKQRRPGYVHPIGVEQDGYVPYYPEQLVGPYTPYTPWESPSTQPQKITPPSIEKPEQKKDEGRRGGEKPAAKEEKKKSEEETAIDRALGEAMDNIAQIDYLIDENDHLKRFGEYMSNSKEDYDPAAVTALNEIQTHLKKATETIRRTGVVWFSRLDQSTKNNYAQQFSEMINKDETAAPLRKLIGEIESLEKARSGIDKKKQYAFFDEQTRQELEKQPPATPERSAAQRAQAGTAQLQAPTNEFATAEKTSIFTIANDFKKLKESVEKLKTIKQKAAPKKQASEPQRGGGRGITAPRVEGVAE